MRTPSEGDGRTLRSVPDGATGTRRLVAVAVSAADLLQPGSALRHVADTAGEIDVLVARVDSPDGERRPEPMDAPDYDAPDGPGSTEAVGAVDELLSGFTVPLPADLGPVHAVDPHVDPHLPASLHLHRLDLRWPVQEADVPDLVAALSELIGFDPDDEVFCVAPAVGSVGLPDPEEAAVDRAVRRVARVYGLPVLHYRRGPGDDVADDLGSGLRTGGVAALPEAVV